MPNLTDLSSFVDEFQKFGSATLKMHEGLFDGGTYSSSFSAPVTSTVSAAAGSASTASSTAIKAEEDLLDKDSQPQNTQYLTPTCVLLTYFSGDIAANVDDHFTRSLSDTQGSTSKQGGSPASWKGKEHSILILAPWSCSRTMVEGFAYW